MRNLKISETTRSSSEMDAKANEEAFSQTSSSSFTYPTYTASSTTKSGDSWGKLRATNPHVYFGHDAARNLQIHPHATGLDTGACYGRQLTCVVVPGHEIVSVPSRRVYEEPKGVKSKS